jgi:putative transposase
MSRKGNCWDAPSESFFNSLKNERVYGARYETRDAARADVFDYIEVFYNRVRRHTSLGGISPVSFHETWLSRRSTAFAGGIRPARWYPKNRWKVTPTGTLGGAESILRNKSRRSFLEGIGRVRTLYVGISRSE